MLPSTSQPSTTTTNRPTLVSIPASAAASTPASTTGPSLVIDRHTPTAPSAAAAVASALPGAPAFTGPPTITTPHFNVETGHLFDNLGHQEQRHPSPPLDTQSTGSSGSVPAGQGDASDTLLDQRTKKRRTGPGSRGVASLTHEQLLKKRANDRLAQRAIRERTKQQIESLEHKIKELTELQPQLELQKALRQKEAAEAQNAELKKHLASIVALIQPLLSSNDQSSYAAVQEQDQGQFPSPSARSDLASENASTPFLAIDPRHLNSELLGINLSLNLGSNSAEVPVQQSQNRISTLNIEGQHFDLSRFLDLAEPPNKMRVDENRAIGSSAHRHRFMNLYLSTLAHPEYRNGMSTSSALYSIDSPLQSLNPARGSPIITNSFAVHVPPTCVFDELIFKFLDANRQDITDCVADQDLEGHNSPSVSSLLNSADIPPMATFLLDILSKFSDVYKMPEKIASLYFMFETTQWLMSPNPESIEISLSCSRPLPIQATKPHPIWMDFIPFPGVRKMFIFEYDSPHFSFDRLLTPYTSTLSLNWPYAESDVLLEIPDRREIIINPVFKRHFFREENWTLGDLFHRTFPTLEGQYYLRSESRIFNQNKSKSMLDK